MRKWGGMGRGWLTGTESQLGKSRKLCCASVTSDTNRELKILKTGQK